MTCCVEVSVAARRRAGAWLLLGLISLALSSLFALMLAGARAPGWTALPLLQGFFNTALVLHVNLSVTVWFLAFLGALWSLAGGERGIGLDWLAFGLVLLGALLLILSPWMAPADPVLSDYLPTLRNQVFFAGCFLLGAGMSMAAMRALFTIAPFGRVSALGVPGSGLFAAALCVMLAMVAFVSGYWRVPQELMGKAYFDPLYWAGGHLLQFAHVLSMLTVWLVLAKEAGIGRLMSDDKVRWLFWLGFLPVVLAVYPGLFYPPDSLEHRRFFTALMSWGSWLVVPVFAGMLMVGWWRERESGSWAGGALWGSMLLFALGVATGVLINGDTVMVTAHYHGTVGAVTLAYMGMTMVLLPTLGSLVSRPVFARLQASLYVFGLWLLVLGLAWSGERGAPRKMPMVAHGPDMARAPEGMALMGAGATIALVATLLFLVPALKSMLMGRVRFGRASLVLLVAGLIGVVGGVIHFLPDSSQSVPVSGSMEVADPELVRRFQEGAMMLHAKRFEYAATAFHWVLQRAPQMPEAHVNMGFAMLGLERFDVARDFFNAAINLRSTQVNGYYGLAVALEGLKDMGGARGAMRTFIHLSPADAKFLPKARAALWEWEQSVAP